MLSKQMETRTDLFELAINDELTATVARELASYRCTTCLMGLPCRGRERWERIAERLTKQGGTAHGER